MMLGLGVRLCLCARDQQPQTNTRPILPCYRDKIVGTGPAGRKEAKLPLPSQAQNQHFIHDKEESFVGRKRSFAPSAQQRFFLYVYYPGKQILGREGGAQLPTKRSNSPGKCM